MTIVRYTNKKTGAVSLYESTSHYDPETKQSRPVRKYLGQEDPVTGELIPTGSRRGRKKQTEAGMEKTNPYQELYEKEREKSREKDLEIGVLLKRVEKLEKCLRELNSRIETELGKE